MNVPSDRQGPGRPPSALAFPAARTALTGLAAARVVMATETGTHDRYRDVAEGEIAVAAATGLGRLSLPEVMARNLFVDAVDDDPMRRRWATGQTLRSRLSFSTFGDHRLIPLRLDDGHLVVAGPAEWDPVAVSNLVSAVRAAGFEVNRFPDSDSADPGISQVEPPSDGLCTDGAHTAGHLQQNATAQGDECGDGSFDFQADPADDSPAIACPAAAFIDDVAVELTTEQEIDRQLSGFRAPSPERIDERALTFAADPENNAQALIQLMEDLWVEALDCGASDVDLWFVPGSTHNFVFFHVHGVREYRHCLPEKTMGPLVSAIKRQADVHEYSIREKIQKGRLSIPWQGRLIDGRVGTGPGPFGGEEVSIRLLDLAKLPPLWVITRHCPDARTELNALTNAPAKMSGAVLVSGTTGQGKTTTLAAIEAAYDRVGFKIIEIASPPEYRIPLVWQEDATGRSGRRVADHVEGALRRTPHALVIQEVRTEEDGDAAAQAIDSGHLTYLTLHAGSAAQTIQRFVDRLGDDYRKVAHTIIGEHLRLVMNQLLVPTLCHVCRQPAGPAHRRFGDLKLEFPRLKLKRRTAEVYDLNPDGCVYCRRKGVAGRVLAAETLVLPRERDLRAAIVTMVRDRKYEEIQSADGVLYQPRAEVLGALLEEGAVGVSAVRDLLMIGA